MPQLTLANIARAAAWAFGAAVLALIASAVAVAVVLTLRPDVEAIKDGTTPAAVEQVQVRAETRMLLCLLARDDAIAAHSVQVTADVNEVCDGYRTLADAYETEGVPPRD